MYQAVVFDLDGTLLNTLNELAYTVNSVLKRHDLPTHPVDEFRRFIGDGVATLVWRAVPEDWQSGSKYDRILDEVLVEYGNNLNRFTVVYDGITELLNELTARNIRMAILSNKAHQFMPGVMAQYFTHWQFEYAFGARTGVPVKPDPTSAREIAGLMQLSPSEIIYLGDSDVDINTAIGAGMYPVGAGWGLRGKDELAAAGAAVVLDHPVDLLKLFN